MASDSSDVHAPIGAKEIGSFFIQQYYDILQKNPQYACRFYNEGSHLVIVDRLDTGSTDTGSTETATTLESINDILMSLEFDTVVIESIHSVNSWKDGILVVLCGYMDIKVDFEGAPVGLRKKFTQTIFLAPQNKGYFVESDIVHYLEASTIEDGSEQHSVDEQEPDKALEAESSEYLNSAHLVEKAHLDTDHSGYKHDNEPDNALEAESSEYLNSVHLVENAHLDTDHSGYKHDNEPDNALEAESSEYLNSVHVVDKSHLDTDHSGYKHDKEPETVKEKVPLEVSSVTQQSDKHSEQKPVAAVMEPVAEPPPKFSYASMVQKGIPKGEASIQPSYVKMAPPLAVQPPRRTSVASRPASVASDRSEGTSLPHGESVYVKNLPPGISKHDVLEEFKQFGQIKQDGVFVRTSSDSAFCFGFVDFVDSASAQNAVTASPLSLDGRPVYIEFKKAGTSPSGPPPRGGRGGGGQGQGRGGRGGRY